MVSSNHRCITSTSTRTTTLPIVLLFLFSPTSLVSARSWTDTSNIHSTLLDEYRVEASTQEVDPFSFTWTSAPTMATDAPTQSPAQYYHFEPSPTRTPYSTSPPTTHPATQEDGYPENDVPANPPKGYFNYDDSDASKYGPGYLALVRGDDGYTVEYKNNGWASVETPSDSYWNEFTTDGSGAWKGTFPSKNFDNNQCGNVGVQSPIDIRLSGVACVEQHQIRSLPGDYRVSGSGVDKRIEPSKLQLVWDRRPCGDWTDPLCAEPDPPHADFPHGWAGFADALHVDFKVPSEHYIYGQAFDAEMQIYHLHPSRARLPVVSVLIRAVEGRHNAYLQQAIDAFQDQYDIDAAACASRLRKQRRAMTHLHTSLMGDAMVDPTMTDFTSWADYSTLQEAPDFESRQTKHRRSLGDGIWSPYHEDLISTYYFYGYDGSLTEPPCTEIVSWFVMDTPMIISPEQLEQMKRILFTHVDEDCKATSVHYGESVARPLQDSADRQVWQCTSANFLPDDA
eukprot:Nitzschia sp. Nitz4//scaffold413_size9536//7739//9268//NITZ4_009097-RA/size9536-processed-gene-0.4-mRNA-1//1//CDS//3329551343//8424//frame0